jgi:hypothetical protein
MFKILSSTNKRVLVVSDPHIRWQGLEAIIQKENPDTVVVLGDFFDSHAEIGLGLREQREMASWLATRLSLDRGIVGARYDFHAIKGNHDLPYCYPQHFLMCPGFSDPKDLEIKQVMSGRDWDKVDDFLILDDYLLTHAGLHSIFIPSGVKNIEDIKQWLPKQVEDAHRLRRENVPHWIFNQGYRMGHPNFGGIFWCDARHEFVPHPTIKQIFGHTYHGDGIKDFGLMQNICIDTALRNYIIVSNGNIEIKSL